MLVLPCNIMNYNYYLEQKNKLKTFLKQYKNYKKIVYNIKKKEGYIMIERNDYLNILKRFKDKELIKVITGIRRCGKSTLLEIYKNYLLQNGIEEDQIISINLEDLKYNFIENYMSLYNYINEKINSNKKNYIFIDEVQKINEFQKAIDSLYIKKNVDLYITGSNANLLSSELATLLSGRYIEIKMLPLSFKEYKEAYKSLNNDELYQKYISFGSFPYTTQLDTEDDVSMYLRVSTMIL